MNSALRSKISTGLMDYVSNGNHPLYVPQVGVMKDIANHLDVGHDYGYIKRPTASGKTVNYVAEIAALGMRALILTPRTNLIIQTRDTFLNRKLFDFDPEQVGMYYHELKSAEKAAGLKAQILITTYPSYMGLTRRRDISGRDYPLVILDEVHHARGDVIRPMIQELFGEVYVQGWTATDTFVTGQNIGDYLFNGAAPIHITTIQQAISNGEIAPYKNIIVETHLSTGVNVEGTRDYTSQELDRIVRQAGRNDAAIRMFLEYQDEETGLRLRDMKSIWYCAGVDHAEEVADKLTDIFGENYALAVSGQTPKRDLEQILRMHRQGKLPILVNADLLIEGFDSPSTQLAMMLRPTRSPIIAEQTGGRILRPDPKNRNKIGYVVTFVDEGMYDVVPFGVVAGNMLVVPEGIKYPSRRLYGDNDTKRSKVDGNIDFYDFPEVSDMDVRISQLDLDDFIKRRNEHNFTIGSKPSGFGSRTDWSYWLNENPDVIYRLWDDLQKRWEALGEREEPVRIEGMSLPKEWFGVYRGGGRTGFYIHKGAERALEQLLELMFEKDYSQEEEMDLIDSDRGHGRFNLRA